MLKTPCKAAPAILPGLGGETEAPWGHDCKETEIQTQLSLTPGMCVVPCCSHTEWGWAGPRGVTGRFLSLLPLLQKGKLRQREEKSLAQERRGTMMCPETAPY